MSKRPIYKHGISRGRIRNWPPDADDPRAVASRARYIGNAIHKTYPSPAGPPALRADESECWRYAVEDWPRLQDALRQAIEATCVSEFRGDWPARAWVWINGTLHEARLTGNGEYHG